MFRMYASNSHSYTHLILALGIVRKPTVWVFITSKYPGIHDIGLATDSWYCARVIVCVGDILGKATSCKVPLQTLRVTVRRTSSRPPSP